MIKYKFFFLLLILGNSSFSFNEIDSLKIGDEIAEGDILVEIDRNPSIWEAEYDPAEYNQEEGVY